MRATTGSVHITGKSTRRGRGARNGKILLRDSRLATRRCGRRWFHRNPSTLEAREVRSKRGAPNGTNQREGTARARTSTSMRLHELDARRASVGQFGVDYDRTSASICTATARTTAYTSPTRRRSIRTERPDHRSEGEWFPFVTKNREVEHGWTCSIRQRRRGRRGGRVVGGAAGDTEAGQRRGQTPPPPPLRPAGAPPGPRAGTFEHVPRFNKIRRTRNRFAC